MYAIQSLTRIYALVLLCVCSALFPVSAIAAIEGYWDASRGTFITAEEVQRTNQKNFGSINRPANSTINVSNNPWNVSKNAAGGLSTTSNATIRTLNHPSVFTGTFNHSLISAQNALKSCVRSPVCAVRGLGTAGIIYSGIQGWMDVYDYFFDEENQKIMKEEPWDPIVSSNPQFPSSWQVISVNVTSSHSWASTSGFVQPHHIYSFFNGSVTWYYSCANSYQSKVFVGGRRGSPGIICYYALPSQVPEDYFEGETAPATLAEVEQSIDEGYSPEPSDWPIVLPSSQFESIFLSTPEPVELPATETISTNSLGETETTVKEQTLSYEVANNPSPSPSIKSTLVENTTVYNNNGNVIHNSTSTTTSEGVQAETPAPIEIELPEFCTWATFICDWLDWTKEPPEGEEPDLAVLISEFEPDEGGYNSGIGAGSCPAPMSLNLGIVNRVVEVSYQPFCDFLAMIRPLVIAAAWLLSAFMYVGVLRRG